MSFINPLFFLGALAASVPIFLHLIKRERAQKIEFPTLMFLRRISKKTIRYQKLRHLLLLLLRILAFLLLALAFTRPFRETPQAAAAAGKVTTARIILFDNSLSMSYGDRWARARQAAADIIRRAEPGDKAILLEFSDVTLARTELTAQLTAVAEQVDRVEPGDRPTRYGQALKTAEKFALDAGTGKRIVYLISDFQKSGKAAEEDFRLGAGIELERVDVGADAFSNLAFGDVRVIQGEEALAGGVTLKPAIVNYGTEDRKNVRVSLSADGKTVGEKRIDINKGEVQGIEFQLPGLSPGIHPVVLEVEDPTLTRDNRFLMTIESRGKTPVLSVENSGAGRGGRSPSFFLANALNISVLSPYRLTALPPARFESSSSGALVIWNHVSGGSAALQKKLQDLVKEGGGLVVVVADASQGLDFNRTFGSWLPVRVESPAERKPQRRPGEDYALLTDLRMDHPIFRPFAEPNSGTFSTARFFKHARLAVAAGGDVIARFDNGDPALVSVPLEKGRVLVAAFSADDSGNDLPLKSVFAPFWQQSLRYLENFREGRHSLQIGDTITPRTVLSDAALRQGKGTVDLNQAVVVVDPAQQRLPATSPGETLAVERAGFYEIRAANLSTRVAVNTIPRESDLSHANSEEWVAGWTNTGDSRAVAVADDERLGPEDQERKQRWWRFLLAAALLFLLAEALLANEYVLKTE
jgi:hypothetical protein